MSTTAKPTPSTEGDAAKHSQTETSGVLDDLSGAARKSSGKTAWVGAAVGVGSAAIVAALLYTKKRG